ncbi:MAG: DUF1697 domain-containing protein [Bacteroidota bacterium]|nr:DUF1697 domain-containing protein [Bacteroidota bacterium]
MTTYIALLRGINVSGKKIIKMDDLKKYFESFGMKNVRTYIQSGNVIFQSPQTTNDRLAETLENKLKKILGFDVPVIIRTDAELKKIISKNPFTPKEMSADTKLHVSLLSAKPSKENVDQLLETQSDTDEFRIVNSEVYILCRGGYGESVFSNNFLEKKLGVKATTRNWATLNKLVDLSSA